MTAPTGKPRGRAIIYGEKMRPVSVTLDAESKAKALILGGGKLSAGIRIALARANLAPPATVQLIVEGSAGSD